MSRWLGARGHALLLQRTCPGWHAFVTPATPAPGQSSASGLPGHRQSRAHASARAHTHFKNNKKKNKSLKEERAAEKWERCALILVSVVTSLGASV